jgi:predicted metalloprotease with PDZ domain
LLFDRYSGERGFSDGEIQEAAEEISGKSQQDFFDACVRGRREIDFEDALEYWGLRFRDPREDLPTDSPPVWLGIETGAREGKLLVQSVREDGPARRVGLYAEDEILALGGYRVDPQTFKERLSLYKPEERVELLVARRDAVRIVPVTLQAAPGLPWRLEPHPEAPAKAVERRRAWLSDGGE